MANTVTIGEYINLTQDSPKIVQLKDDKLTIELMEHQKTAIKAMMTLEENGFVTVNNLLYYTHKPDDYNVKTRVGILGDKVGAGKSLMIVALIYLSRSPKVRDIIYESSKYVLVTQTTELQHINTNLLVVPHKLVTQWMNFCAYVPSLKVYKCATDKEFLDMNVSENYDIIIVACTKFDQFNDKYSDQRWNRIIIDEADTIKLPKTIKLISNFVWLVTGTPLGLANASRAYLNDIFNKKETWLLDYITVKNNNEFIKGSITLPIPQRIYINCLTPNELKIVKDLIPPHVIQMINAGNADEAAKVLNCNESTADNLLKIITKNLIQSIDNKKIELEAEEKKKVDPELKEKRVKIIKKSITRLTDRLDTIKKRIYELNDEYCPVCMGEFTKPTMVNCCKNIFCFECLTLSLAKNSLCPFCRTSIGKHDFNIIVDKNQKINFENKKNKINVETKNKIDVLVDILSSKPDGKILVFANFPETFKKIEKELKLHAITYRILKGSDSDITKYKEEFQNGKIRVLLLNAAFFGAGQNLQMATDVVIYHRFTKEMEQQVIGRAQRLGRTVPLTVYYLLHDNENQNLDDKNEFNDMSYEEYLENMGYDDNTKPNYKSPDEKEKLEKENKKKVVVKGKKNVMNAHADI